MREGQRRVAVPVIALQSSETLAERRDAVSSMFANGHVIDIGPYSGPGSGFGVIIDVTDQVNSVWTWELRVRTQPCKTAHESCPPKTLPANAWAGAAPVNNQTLSCFV